MEIGSIHPQLLKDCHILGSLPSGILLLNRNAALHWFILVPDTELKDVLDLPQDEARQVFEDCAAVSVYIKESLDYTKVNFAGLGNQVPQMHLHIIGRREGDACWPRPVWGSLDVNKEYPPDTLDSWQGILERDYGLCVTA